MRSFTKLILASLMAVLFTPIAGFAVTPLNVHIQYENGTPVQSVTVAAIEFGMYGPSTHTQVGLTDALGDAAFTLEDNRSYNLYYSSHTFSPTISDQFNNPEYDPNRYVWTEGTARYSTFTVTSGLASVGMLVQEFTGATPNKVLFGGVYNMNAQLQAGSGIVMVDGGGNGFLVVDNVSYAGANTYNIGLYDPQLNRGIGRNVMSALDSGNQTVSYTGAAKLDFNLSVPPTRVENNNQQGGSNSGASVEGVLQSTTGATIAHMGLNIKACDGYEWNNWANADENGRFQLYGLTPGVTYYLNVMGGCTWDNNGGEGKCYEPYSSDQFNAPDICAGGTLNDTVNPNDIVYISSDVMYHNVTLKEMPKSIGQIQVYVKSSSGYAMPNANVNINPDGSPWSTVNCATHNFGDDRNNPGFANTNVNTSATGYALLDGLPSGNYMISVWTPFSSGGNGPAPLNAGPDGTFTKDAPNGGGGGGDWMQSHCEGTGVDDYRITIDTTSTPTMTIYDSSGTVVGSSSITYVVEAAGDMTGLVRGNITFPSVSDLTNSPIMITLYPNCGEGGCNGVGNFTVLSGSGASQYNYEIAVASGASYYMNVSAVGWGRNNRGGGNNAISLESTGTVVVDMEFGPAGTISGTVYKPDGTILAPTSNQYVWVDANSENGWTGTQLQKDGTFIMQDVLPGINRMHINVSGGGPGSSSFNYAMPAPAPQATVTAGMTTTLNINLVNANYVGANLDVSKTPDSTIIMGAHEAIMGFRAVPLPAGTVLKGDTVMQLLTKGGDGDNKLRYSPVTGPSEEGPCGMNWNPAGFCAVAMPSPSTYDFYLMRSGDFDDMSSTGSVSNTPYPHFTLVSSAKNVVVDDAHSTSTVRVAYSQGISSGVLVNLTPATDMSARGNSTLFGSVVGNNFFRQADYDSLGGDFERFMEYLPVVSLYGPNGGFKAAGIVVPPPSFIKDYGQDFNLSFAQGYAAFKALLDLAGTFSYEIRGLAPSTCYTAVLTTPNYPPYQTRACMGVNGSTTTLSVNLDTAVGAGATVHGVVMTTNSVVLANAAVELFGEAIGQRSVITNSSGVYRFEGLPEGSAKLKVSLGNYASAEAKQDLVGSNVYANNFRLTAAGGSITGTVYSQKIPYAKVQSGAYIMAYNDTYNGNNPTLPLPLLKTMTGTDGTYSLTGLIPGDTYKVFLKVPGKYTLNQSTEAISGNIAGIDFTMLPKPLDLEIFGRLNTEAGLYEFTVLNPKDFKEGEAKWSASPYNSGSAAILDLQEKSTGELYGSIPLASLTANITYVLHANATSYSNKTVTREILFGQGLKGNSEQHIDNAILGDDTDDGFGRKNNEAAMDKSGEDASALSFPTGAVLPVSTGAIPTCSFKGEDAGDDNVADMVASLGEEAFAGDVYTVSLDSVSINPDKGFDLTLSYDKDSSDLDDITIARYEDSTDTWEEVPGLATINPVQGTIQVRLKTLASVLAVKNGKDRTRFSSFNGREYVVRPQAGGSSTSGGTFAVVRPSIAGVGTVGPKLKVFNYPNPFNLKDKAVTNNHGLPTTTVNGTVIHVEVPAGNGGPGHIRIYTLAGELVKDISASFTENTYNYIGWDGHNSGGQEVANGVYYGVVEMSGKSPKLKDATFKMAVIK